VGEVIRHVVPAERQHGHRIAAHRRLIATFRRIGAPVVYTKFLATPEPSLLWRWSPQCAPPTLCCRKGVMRSYADVAGELECSDIVAEIYPQEHDMIIEKYGYGADEEGLVLIRLQRYEEAILALKRNTELQPMSPYGWYQLARVHIDRSQPDEAVKIIRHLKGFEPKVAAQLERETGLVA
jgi:tetratricopeptide (TPR) repeat protein